LNAPSTAKLRRRTAAVAQALIARSATSQAEAIAQLAQIAKDYNVANVPVTIVDPTLPAQAFALAIDRVFSGLARTFFGGVSDLIGRVKTMFVAFGVEAIAIIAIAHIGQDPFMFVLLAGAIFFAWGEIYSLFPAACTDTFGENYAATHAGMLRTARGAAALLLMMISAWLPLRRTGMQWSTARRG
jgi:OFA family oxalate/formate antiporter-like MFS transporter